MVYSIKTKWYIYIYIYIYIEGPRTKIYIFFWFYIRGRTWVEREQKRAEGACALCIKHRDSFLKNEYVKQFHKGLKLSAWFQSSQLLYLSIKKKSTSLDKELNHRLYFFLFSSYTTEKKLHNFVLGRSIYILLK